MHLRFTNTGVGECRVNGRLGFWGNLGGGWTVARRGCGFGEKCGVVGIGDRPGNQNRGNGRRGKPGMIAAVDRLLEGVAVMGRNAGLWLWGNAAEQMPGNRNRGNGRRGKSGMNAAVDRLPEGVAVMGRNAGLWLWGNAENKSRKSPEISQVPRFLDAWRLSSQWESPEFQQT